jgi:soluble lytic murein transglycosylase-like protein
MKIAMIKKLLRLIFYSLPLIAFIANSSEPRAKVSAPQSTQNFSLPLKVTIYKSQRTPLAGRSSSPDGPFRLPGGRPNVREVKAYVRTEAVEYGVDPFLALWIVKHESSFNPRAKGDGEASRGLWQISKIYHPEVSDAMAFNVASSTEWSLERIRSGKVSEWSTYRNCRTLYADCPY